MACCNIEVCGSLLFRFAVASVNALLQQSFRTHLLYTPKTTRNAQNKIKRCSCCTQKNQHALHKNKMQMFAFGGLCACGRSSATGWVRIGLVRVGIRFAFVKRRSGVTSRMTRGWEWSSVPGFASASLGVCDRAVRFLQLQFACSGSLQRV